MLHSSSYRLRGRQVCCVVLAVALCGLFLLASCSYHEERSGSGRRVKKQSVIDNTPLDRMVRDRLFAVGPVSNNLDVV